MLKSLIKKLLLKAGLNVSFYRKNYQLDLYTRVYGSKAVEERRFYNVGQAAFFHPAWTIIDYFKKADGTLSLPGSFAIHHDLMSLQPLPIETATAELIYSSHTLEHVNNKAVAFFLKEAYRILKPGGIIRIVTPDIKLTYRAWQENDVDFFYWVKNSYSANNWHEYNLRIPLREASLTQIFLEDFAAAVSEIVNIGAEKRFSDEEIQHLFKTMKMEDAMDYLIERCPEELQNRFPFQHMNWFTEEKWMKMLNEAGFTQVYPSRWGQSRSPVMRDTSFFDTSGPKLSLYMEAVR